MRSEVSGSASQEAAHPFVPHINEERSVSVEGNEASRLQSVRARGATAGLLVTLARVKARFRHH